jgi:tetratricopeptide (TPR) repeat protein
MKRFVSFALLSLLSVSLLILVGCQSKEVTSAKVYIQQDDWDKAIEQLEIAVETFPTDAEARTLLGKGYGKKGNYTGMMEQFNAALATGPRFQTDINPEIAYYWTSQFNDGVKAFNAGTMDKAIENFKTCILLDPTKKDAYKNLASCHQRTENFPSAISVLEEFLAKNPTDVETMLKLHDMYVITKEYDKSITVLNSAKEKDPENVDILSALAITYDMKGERDQAFEVYNRAIEKNPENPDLLFNLARLHFMKNDFESAIKYFDRVIAINPDDFESNLNVGNAYLGMAEKTDKALREEEEKIGKELSDKRAEVKSLYMQSIPYLEKALEVKPDQAGVWNNLGVAYIRTDQVEKGKAAFNKAEELNNSEQ